MILNAPVDQMVERMRDLGMDELTIDAFKQRISHLQEIADKGYSIKDINKQIAGLK